MFTRIQPTYGKHKIIYADPPWVYRDKCHAGERGAGCKYDLMTLQQICDLRPMIDELAAKDCLLAMWWVPPQPREALRVVESWGFTLTNMFGFVWRKETVNGKLHIGMGNMTRQNDEACLFAKRGRPQRVSAAVRSSLTAQIREHSRKPDEVRTRLVQLMGDVPRIELFARHAFDGWDVWGKEAPKKR